MKKIAFFIYEKDDLFSGGYLYDEKLIGYLKNKNIRVETIPLENISYLENIEHNFSEKPLERLNDDIDMVIQDELCHPSLFYLNRKIDEEIPIVSIVHHLSHLAERDRSRSNMYRYFEKKYLETVDGAICSSKSTEKSVKDLVEMDNIITAYPGKDHLSSDSSSTVIRDFKERTELKLLYVGNILPHKCIDTLIEGIETFDDVKLTMIGDITIDEKYTEKIQSIIEKKDIGPSVDILGFVDQDVLIKEYEENHLLVLPSKFEGYGITIVEGLKFGLPAIVTKKGGPKEIIREEKEGLHIQPCDPSSIEKAIRKIKKDLDLIKKMSENAKKRYDELPTWKDSMGKAYEFLTEFGKA